VKTKGRSCLPINTESNYIALNKNGTTELHEGEKRDRIRPAAYSLPLINAKQGGEKEFRKSRRATVAVKVGTDRIQT